MRLLFNLCLAIGLFLLSQPASACHLSCFAVDSVVPSGPNYVIHSTFCVGTGRTGTAFGADQNTGIFAFGFWAAPGFSLLSTSPTTLTPALYPSNTAAYNLGSMMCPPTTNPWGFACMQSYIPSVAGRWFGCIISTGMCGDVVSQTFNVQFTTNAIPDSMVVLGLEGANLLTNGCYTVGMYPSPLVVYPKLGVSVNPFREEWCKVYAVQGESRLVVKVLQSSDKEMTLSLMNTEAERVLHTSLGYTGNGVTREFDLSALPAGVYFATLTDGERQFAQKVVLW